MCTKSFVLIAFFIFTSKMISNLGWKHKVELNEGIKQVYKFYEEKSI